MLESKYPIVFLIDSFDFTFAQTQQSLSWVEKFFVQNTKIIITVTTDTLETGAGHYILNEFKKLGHCTDLVLECSIDLWNDITVYGSGENYTTAIDLRLPDEWKNIDEKNLIKAKVIYSRTMACTKNDLNEAF